MKPSITPVLRPLTVADTETYRNLMIHGCREVPEDVGLYLDEWKKRYSIDSLTGFFREKWNSDEQYVLGAFDDSTLVGTLSFTRPAMRMSRHKGILWGFYVHPAVRRKGVGRFLIRDVIRRANRLEDLEELHLRVRSDNSSALTLYQSLGFQRYGREERALNMDGRFIAQDYLVLTLPSGN